MLVRTRFAPSPTGSLHVGGVRTALFAWLYARHYKGEFVLRIEDTDQERSTAESVQAILDGMAWLGLNPDEGPFYQTQRYDRYKEIAQKLLDTGHAYRCSCTKERLEDLREKQMANKEKPRYDGCCREKQLPPTDEPHVLRFKNPLEGQVSFKDQVYGNIHVSNQELDDFILIRSDGHPTYNFAVVIDDWDMKITHVIRGDDHINNTPRQINLFKALNAPIPIFAHLPMILGEDGKRLSKRHGAVNVLQFKEMGILPNALLNYLVRLGWAHGDQEIFSIDEMIQFFTLDKVSRGVSSFNYEKLYWLNQHYQRYEQPELVSQALRFHLEALELNIENGPNLTQLVQIQAERCKTLKEMAEKSLYFFQENIDYDPAAVKKHLRPVVLAPLETLYRQFQSLSTWDKDAVQTCINEVCAEFDISMGKLAQPLRVAVTGSSASPSIDMTLTLLGKKRVLSRLEKSIANLHERSQNQN